MSDDSSEEVVLKLTKAEALVLWDFVSRFSETDVLDIRDRAEAQVIWNICCQLEKDLVKPFKSEYAELLQAARDELRPLDLED